jgi:murein DD-endopeptidase MepM/ murein hydrolase activator NlpD
LCIVGGKDWGGQMYGAYGYSQKFNLKPKRDKNKILALTAILSVALFSAVGVFYKRANISLSSRIFKVGPTDAFETPISLLDNFFAANIRVYDEIQIGENLYLALKRLGVSGIEAERFSKALGKEVNLHKLLPKDTLMVESASNKIQLSHVKADSDSMIVKAIELFTRTEDGVAMRIRAEIKEDDESKIEISTTVPEIYREHALINGTVNNSIYQAITQNGGDAQLVNNFADIFGWQFDFFKDTRALDTYQMVVEKNVSAGRFIGYGRILAAEYNNAGKKMRGFYFESVDKKISGFYDETGYSLKNAFLKAPLKLASISSRFGMRFHPVQKRMKSHNGVDYGARRGTPFMAVANGVVINAGYTPFNGNWVRIRHNNGYETEYLHATNLAKGIRVGRQVKQGQIIGYVGSTGMSTGPHLHFGMKHNKSYVNPSAQKFAKTERIPKNYMSEFSRSIEAMQIALNRQNPKQNVLALGKKNKDERTN